MYLQYQQLRKSGRKNPKRNGWQLVIGDAYLFIKNNLFDDDLKKFLVSIKWEIALRMDYLTGCSDSWQNGLVGMCIISIEVSNANGNAYICSY